LNNLNAKKPDAHWTVDLNVLPNPPPPGTFVVGAGGNIAPQLVFEVAVLNETTSMSTLTQTDLARYFAVGTGTRWWVGIKMFKNLGGTNRWWDGHASPMDSFRTPRISAPNRCLSLKVAKLT
jgi:hypothetical protein